MNKFDRFIDKHLYSLVKITVLIVFLSIILDIFSYFVKIPTFKKSTVLSALLYLYSPEKIIFMFILPVTFISWIIYRVFTEAFSKMIKKKKINKKVIILISFCISIIIVSGFCVWYLPLLI